MLYECSVANFWLRDCLSKGLNFQAFISVPDPDPLEP
jgi:hypothetical protein